MVKKRIGAALFAVAIAAGLWAAPIKSRGRYNTA